MKTLPFKIGADPEFTYVNNNIRYSAMELITKYCQKQKFQQFITQKEGHMGYKIEEAGTLGWDGHKASGEIRPKESNSPEELTTNIGKLLTQAHKALTSAEIKTTSIWMSIGGHIHLESKEWNNKQGSEIKIIQRALASLALPIFATENPINVEIRREKGRGYGDILDARVNGITYEFRPLTAEWLTTPEICNATLSYMGVIWNEIYNHPEKLEEIAEVIAKSDQQIRALHEIIIDEYSALTEGLLNKIKSHVEKFELYKEFKEECDFIFETQKIKEIKEKVEYDIVRGWNLRKKETEINLKEILDEEKTNKKLKEINLDGIMGYLQIFWSEERNMEKIARKIGDTAIAWEWQMNNRYFLIPLEKGIPEIIATNGKEELITGAEMIKTKADQKYIEKIIKTGISKHEHRNEFKRTTIDLKSGAIETDEYKSIVIGIPYEMREGKEGHEKILTLIHEIEAGKIEAKKLPHVTESDIPTSDKTYGEGYIMTMIKTNKEQEPQLVPQTDTTEDLYNKVKIQEKIKSRKIKTEITQKVIAEAEMEALGVELGTEITTN